MYSQSRVNQSLRKLIPSALVNDCPYAQLAANLEQTRTEKLSSHIPYDRKDTAARIASNEQKVRPFAFVTSSSGMQKQYLICHRVDKISGSAYMAFFRRRLQ